MKTPGTAHAFHRLWVALHPILVTRMHKGVDLRCPRHAVMAAGAGTIQSWGGPALWHFVKISHGNGYFHPTMATSRVFARAAPARGWPGQVLPIAA